MQPPAIVLRPATIRDAADLAELMYVSAQSQFSNSGYDFSLGGSRLSQIVQLTKLARAQARSWFHYSNFVVAQAADEDKVVACAAGYERIAADRHVAAALREIGWSAESISALADRLAPLFETFPPEPVGFWTVDHVAVLPAQRGLGLARRCVAAVLERGQLQQFQHAKLDVFSGNAWAKRIYESLGFKISEVFESEVLQTVLKRTPLERMLLHF